tara:strand:- start:317 stop:541 length:225 start_codon:yes stop_codon:yes gene_type:complete
MRTLKEYKKLQKMKTMLYTKVKFITDYMQEGEYDVMNLDLIETNKGEFDEPYFTNKDSDRFCTLEYALKNKIKS